MAKLTDAQIDQLTADEYDNYLDRQVLENPNEYFTKSDISKLTSNQETDISSTESINIENSEKVSTEAKKEMEETTNENNEDASEAKAKLIIKIPKPFALGYIIIDLSKLLGNLLKGLAAGIAALVLAKIADALSELLQDKLATGGVSDNDINTAFNDTDINGIIAESTAEYNNSLSTTENTNITSDMLSTDNDNKIVDVYSKSNVNKKQANKNKYSMDKRNRKDILESEVVSERNGTSNKNIKTVSNPNYGVYLD